MRNYLLAILFVAPCVLSAQNALQKKVEWYSTKAVDNVTQEVLLIDSKFIIDKNQSIQWIQKQGEMVYNFTILKTESTWVDMKHNGSIRYEVKTKDIVGFINIGKYNKNFFIELEFVLDGVNTAPFKFIIDKTTVL
jgi:hypothetical protein